LLGTRYDVHRGVLILATRFPIARLVKEIEVTRSGVTYVRWDAMVTRICSCIALSVLLLLQMVSGQTQAGPENPSEQPTILHSITREVLLDLVVRDRHHHAVTDIRPDEIEVYEDGVRQKINSFRNVEGAEQLQLEQDAQKNVSGPGAATTSKSANATGVKGVPSQNRLHQTNFVSIIFAQIAPLNLEFAREAVHEFLKSDTLPNTYVTIYSLGYNLNLVQPYTNDQLALTKAVDAAAKGVRASGGLDISSQVASGANAAAQATAANLLANPNLGPGQATAVKDAALNPLPTIVQDPLWMRNAASQDVSVTLGSALLTQADMVKGLRFADSLANGMTAMDALHALVHSQENLPGRKVVLYLADGLQFPVNRRDVVDHLISYANRSGVTFYTVDTQGLTAEDPLAKSIAQQERTAADSSVSNVDPHTAVFEDDDNHLATTSNDQLSMRELAESTGGFAVANTNQIADPMQRVMEDIRTHYELAYTPTSTDYDGHFRRIEVKITRPKVTVQTRSGYYALPELNGEPVQPFEMAALKALALADQQRVVASKAPDAPIASPAPTFPYDVSPVKFRSTPNAANYEIAFEIPVSSLSVLSDPKTDKARLQLSLFALIRNSSGEIIGKLSRDLSRDMTNAELPQLSKDHIVYAEPLDLPPGHYVLDTAVTDELANKTAVKRVSFFVQPGKDLGLSSVEVVRKFLPLSGPRNLHDPFELASARVLPTFADSHASGKPIALYFVVYPAKLDSTDAPKVTMEMLRDGKEIGRQPLTLPKPDVDGSIPVLMQVSPSPGQCDIVITAQQGTLAAQSTLSVKIE
jgi:VWFA-related protein